jgi:PAS domain S-box-containing protein
LSATTRLWLAVVPAALAVGAAASALMAVSNHQDAPLVQAVLTALTGASFIGAGLIARVRRPENRTGLLLIAVGFTWFVAAGLMASNDSLPWTVGIAVSAIPAGFLIHLLLAYPSGRLASRWDRIVVVTGYALVVAGNISHMPFKSDPVSCDDCPSNAFLISENETAATAIEGLLRTFAVLFLLAVVVTLIGRWQHASPAARRALGPVLVAGGSTLFLFAISVGAQSFSMSVSEVAEWTATLVLIGVPFLFLWGLLQSRLARADISRALAEEPGQRSPEETQASIRRLLHDPTAELLFWYGEEIECYTDVHGNRRDLEAVSAGRAVTLIERRGRRLAAIVHDRALLDEPELVEQVAAAVGLEVERDLNLYELQASERRSRALIEAMPDNMFRISADGIFLDIQETPHPSPGFQPVEAKAGSSLYDYPVPRELIDRVMAAGRQSLETGELQTIEWELGAQDGSVRFQEGRFMPSGEREFFLVVRDVTRRKLQEAERAALHRIAIAVASEARAEQIFGRVAEEIGRGLGAHSANLVRFESATNEAVVVGAWHERDAFSKHVGERFRLTGTASERVFMTGGSVRFESDDGDAPPELGEHMSRNGIGSLIATPINVAGRPWGAVVATVSTPHSFPADAQERLGAFTQLVSLALANEEAREQLATSRARLVSAGDEERRRLERNLHDGAQQRLVSVSVSLRLAQSALASDPKAADELLDSANTELKIALEELRELARGIHPAVLTDRGLGPALASLADRAPVPVELERVPVAPLPRPVEAAVYYVVSEALANVAKYAQASSVRVRVVQEAGRAVVKVIDDGVGGADPKRGSGLNGLTDRVEALDGCLIIHSPPGEGTTIWAEIPVRLAAPEDAGLPPGRARETMPALDV